MQDIPRCTPYMQKRTRVHWKHQYGQRIHKILYVQEENFDLKSYDFYAGIYFIAAKTPFVEH